MAYAFVGSNPTPSTKLDFEVIKIMKQIACFDLAGVSVKEHLPFSVRLIERQGSEIKPAVDEFFTRYFGAVMIGESSLPDAIAPFLNRFNWEGNLKSLLGFWFEGEKDPVNPVLRLARETRDSGTPTYIVTDNPAERVAVLWDELLADSFTGRYVSGETGLKKNRPELWTKIARDNNVLLANIFFTDDDPENVAAAKSAGVDATLYTNPAKLQAALRAFINS